MSRSSSRWERKSAERKAQDRHRSYRDDDRSHKRSSRWERKSSEHESRDRSERSRRYRDYDDDYDDDREPSKERSSKKAVIGASGTEIIGYKSSPPNSTIMIRGLAPHIVESDIRQDIIQCGLMPKEIRLVRAKDTGVSRGFAFVEFLTLEEATRWIDMKQGVLVLQEQYRAIMQYSIPKAGSQAAETPPANKAAFDWFCVKCGAQNFKRRENCFKCYASRTESEAGGSGSDEVSSYVTKTIMLRNLDALTTEDSVIQVLNKLITEVAKKISAVCIGRDPLTSTSRGICYLGTESTVDALALYGALTTLTPPLEIDGKVVAVSYCRYNMGDTDKAHEQAFQAAFPNASQPSTYALSDVNQLADYSASRYAKSVDEYQQYFEYYKSYFAQQIAEGNSITLQSNQTDAANAAAAVAQSAMQRKNAAKNMYNMTALSVPNGIDSKHYPVPDVTKYTYDKNSGYYYDTSTGLYYDSTTGYYWNSMIQRYLYYDPERSTYLLAPTTTTSSSSSLSSENTASQQRTEGVAEVEPKKQKVEKHDKVKVAKKVAKDMEKWAKTLNQKKENSMVVAMAVEGISNNQNSSGSADIGYSVLEKKNSNSALHTFVTSYSPQAATHANVSVLAKEADLSDEEKEPEKEEKEFLDFTKLICTLCKRQLPSAEALTKHGSFSELHKKNLEIHEITTGKKVYRDRAKERRMKYGSTDEPQTSELKEKYLKAREMISPPVNSAAEPIGVENVGNRLLQKMGWSQGQGLGKTNQGRTTIIEAEQRTSTAGLGNKSAYTAVVGESYKDSVKKVLYARYQDL